MPLEGSKKSGGAGIEWHMLTTHHADVYLLGRNINIIRETQNLQCILVWRSV